jgi:hypothetical protein
LSFSLTSPRTRSFAFARCLALFPLLLLPGFARQGREKLEERQGQSKAASASREAGREKKSNKQEASPHFLSPPPPLFLSPAHNTSTPFSRLVVLPPPPLPPHVLLLAPSSPLYFSVVGVKYYEATSSRPSSRRIIAPASSVLEPRLARRVAAAALPAGEILGLRRLLPTGWRAGGSAV